MKTDESDHRFTVSHHFHFQINSVTRDSAFLLQTECSSKPTSLRENFHRASLVLLFIFKH